MPTDDPQQFAERLRAERGRLTDSTAVHEVDRDPIKRWIRQKDGTVETGTLEVYLRRVRLASERSSTPITEMDEADFHDLVFTLRHEHDLSDSTIESYENAVLLLIQDIVGAEWPEDVDRTRAGRNNIQPDDVLEPADIQALTSTARHQRDVAFIEFLADTGARLSLALSLRVSDVDLTNPPTYTPNGDATGLKGAPITAYPLIDSTGAIRTYLRQSHPRPDDADVALFHKIKPAARNGDGRWSDDGSVRPNAIRQQLVRVADRADVEARVTPHAFRHAAITRMVREGYSRSQIEHRVHWTLDTDMWGTYEHITATEHTEDIFREAGIIEGDDAPDRVRKPCGNCGEPLAPHHDWCSNCGAPVSPGAEAQASEGKETLLEALVEEANPAARNELRTLLEQIEGRPETVSHEPPPEDSEGRS